MKHNKLSMLIAGAALIAAPFAAAVPTVYYDIGAAGTDAAIPDGSAGDTIGLPGAIGSSFSSGGFTVLTNAATKPALGSAVAPALASTQLQLSGTGTITIYFAESGFGPSKTGFLAELSLTSLAPTATVSYFTYATLGALESPLGFLNLAALSSPMTSQILGGVGGNTAGGVLPFAGTGPYNLIQKIVINQPLGGSTQMTANLTSNVPDGGTSLALLGASLLGMGAVRRKLMK